MAKSAKGRAAGTKPGLEAPTSIAARVTLEVGSDVPSYYVNYADLAQSTHEFTLTVAKVATRLGAQAVKDLQVTGEMRVDALLQLVMPPTLLPSLIKAMTVQRDLYEKTYGSIRDGVEPPASDPKGTLQ